jgi:hypothetical protein
LRIYSPPASIRIKSLGMESAKRVRDLALRILLAIALASLCVLSALRAQKPTSTTPKTPADWLSRAAALSDIRAPGSPPFTLHGHIILTDSDGKQTLGTYRLDWNSPIHWREEIALAGANRLRVGGPEKYWEELDKYPPPEDFDRLDRLLNFPLRLHPRVDWQPGKIKERRSGQDRFECVEMSVDAWTGTHLCFDPATGLLVGEVPQLIGQSKSNFDIAARTYIGSFIWGQKSFPRELGLWYGKLEAVALIVDEITPLEQRDPNRFVPPAGAEEWGSCDEPVMAKLLYPPPLLLRTPGTASWNLRAYGVIEAGGNLSHVSLVNRAPGAVDEEQVARAAALWRFSPPTCHGAAYREGVYVTLQIVIGD